MASIALDLSWTELHAAAAELAEAVRVDGPPEVVVGVLRGGMIPAVALAHLLGVRDVRGTAVTHTLADTPGAAKTTRPRVVNPASLGELGGRDVLLVDDVAGSGDTLDTAVELIKAAGARRVRTAVLVVNTVNWAARGRAEAPHATYDYLARTCAGWVRFPWETR
ncbi:phosphoribosyltransferase [Actinokineospora cianjurensis]|uniref:Phosphoribosyltransferase domain-containing protein n=1 Tax=Actinokineospora cianjurensis TaxID=585224 RepID=A0A421B288_9PSEU|nr:phosphoribosyltransferase family protein [Actinokineospora cianjurensis]RLK58383.1 hypothetical protein CLV68_4482 [Actinokineospora cianjurensis]